MPCKTRRLNARADQKPCQAKQISTKPAQNAIQSGAKRNRSSWILYIAHDHLLFTIAHISNNCTRAINSDPFGSRVRKLVAPAPALAFSPIWFIRNIGVSLVSSNLLTIEAGLLLNFSTSQTTIAFIDAKPASLIELSTNNSNPWSSRDDNDRLTTISKVFIRRIKSSKLNKLQGSNKWVCIFLWFPGRDVWLWGMLRKYASRSVKTKIIAFPEGMLRLNRASQSYINWTS